MRLLIALLTRRSRLQTALVLLGGIIAGLCNSALIALVNETIGSIPGSASDAAVAFGLLAASVVVVNTVPEVLLGHLTHGITADLRRRLARELLAAPMRHIERVGTPAVHAVFGRDIQTIVSTAGRLPGTVISGTIVCGCVGYMAWLSWDGLWIVGGSAALTIAIYRVFSWRIQRHWIREREAYSALQVEQQRLVEGVKELKLHAGRRRAYLEEGIAPAIAAAERSGRAGGTASALLHNTLHAVTWMVVGIVLWGVPELAHHDAHVTRGYVLALLYMWGPFRGLMESHGAWIAASIALEKVRELKVVLLAGPEPTDREPTSIAPRDVRSVGLQDAHFTFGEPGSFALGPVSMTLRRGEVVYVIGGNGSGKTTLAKLLTGLYVVGEGQLLLDDEPVAESSLEAYRSCFTAVFFDYHLFPRLYGLDDRPTTTELAHRYIQELGLADKVQVNDGRFSTLALSTGQRKRLALVVALLEDRPFYVFDEWAADQDPELRDMFYRRVLPRLAREGKGVLAITHDDRYHALADRTIRMEYGRVVEASGS